MSSDDIVIFYYEGKNKIVKCSNEEKMSSIFEKFAKSINSSVDDYNFYYNNEKIGNDLTISNLNNDTSDAKIITVKNALKIIKCPD
jgi:hypothetical protein